MYDYLVLFALDSEIYEQRNILLDKYVNKNNQSKPSKIN